MMKSVFATWVLSLNCAGAMKRSLGIPKCNRPKNTTCPKRVSLSSPSGMLPIGAKVEVNYQAKGKWYPGIVRRHHDEKQDYGVEHDYGVEYTDTPGKIFGTPEYTVRRLHPKAHQPLGVRTPPYKPALRTSAPPARGPPLPTPEVRDQTAPQMACSYCGAENTKVQRLPGIAEEYYLCQKRTKRCDNVWVKVREHEKRNQDSKTEKRIGDWNPEDGSWELKCNRLADRDCISNAQITGVVVDAPFATDTTKCVNCGSEDGLYNATCDGIAVVRASNEVMKLCAKASSKCRGQIILSWRKKCWDPFLGQLDKTNSKVQYELDLTNRSSSGYWNTTHIILFPNGPDVKSNDITEVLTPPCCVCGDRSDEPNPKHGGPARAIIQPAQDGRPAKYLCTTKRQFCENIIVDTYNNKQYTIQPEGNDSDERWNSRTKKWTVFTESNQSCLLTSEIRKIHR